MKNLRWAVAVICVLNALSTACLRAQTIPSVITQLASNETMTSFYMRSAVNPGGTNAVAWFTWDTQPTGPLANTTTNLVLVNSNLNVFCSNQLTNLLSGTRYYYQAWASNALGVVSGAVENGVTTQVQYNPLSNGPGINDLIALSGHPYGSEPISIWDDWARLISADLLSFGLKSFNADGTIQNGVIQNAQIANGAITYNQLDPSLQALINAGSNSTISGTLTNALFLMSNFESNSTPAQVTTIGSLGQLSTLYSLNVVSNQYRQLMLEADVVAANKSSGFRRITFIFYVAGVPVNYFTSPTYYWPGDSSQASAAGWHLSVVVSGLQTNTQQVSLEAYSDNSSASPNYTAWVRAMRIWGIP